jgi:hypothetical protein
MNIRIGGVGVGLKSDDAAFRDVLRERFSDFVDEPAPEDYQFDVEIGEPREGDPDDDVRVYRHDRLWRIERGDFRAQFDARERRGRIRQTANPYSVDTLLRIVHTIALAPEGGLLLHAASVVRNGRALVFTGKSGAGKTTISRLAPRDAAVLSDEVSYLRRSADGYTCHGTPFAGELARPGENVSAPLAAIYLLGHGSENRIEPVEPAEAAREILGNVLFFAEDSDLVKAVFRATIALVERVPLRRLSFVPDVRVWDLL